MSQRYGNDGKVIPVTLVEAGPCRVTKIKNLEKDGYKSVQLGFGEAKKINKPLAGQLGELGKFQTLREFRDFGDTAPELGAKIDVSSFAQRERQDALSFKVCVWERKVGERDPSPRAKSF